ncbi:MAG: MoxR family ATPase [Chloroflexi bacterium]|nr:MoxR family ATPase [Chloroflexota bacterium]
MTSPDLGSIDGVQQALATRQYIADRSLSTVIYLGLHLQKPLLLEGEAGVGKTEVAKVLADVLGADLIRLQCYEGLDVSNAVYEWNFTRQMLYLRTLEATGSTGEAERQQALQSIFGPDFLLRRPLLRAIEHVGDRSPVLLIDEIDRSDEEFEAFLLEVLSDYQITVPEIGTIHATRPPVVLITSNRTRELHDALKRRCLFHWIDYPSVEKEEEIILTKVPEAPRVLAGQISRFVAELRQIDLYKLPGVAETLDWARALVALGQDQLEEEHVLASLGALLKYQEDVDRMKGGQVRQILAKAG